MTVALLQQVKTASKLQHKTSIGTTQAVRVRGLGMGTLFPSWRGEMRALLMEGLPEQRPGGGIGGTSAHLPG